MLGILSHVLYALSLALCVTSVLFGAVSLVLLEKWRQFRHFAFLSLIVAGANFLIWMYVWSQINILSIEFILITPVILISHVQMSHWQLISTIMIYKALVDVFSNVKVRCKYLWVCLFGWLLPVVEGVGTVFGLNKWVISWIIVVSVVELAVLITNVVLFVRVVYSLVRLMVTRQISPREVCGKALVSTLACVTAGVPPILGTIALMCFEDYGPVSLLDAELAVLPNLLNVLLANVFFLSMKTHRQLWAEYFRKCRDARASRRELELQSTRHGLSV